MNIFIAILMSLCLLSVAGAQESTSNATDSHDAELMMQQMQQQMETMHEQMNQLHAAQGSREHQRLMQEHIV